MTTPFLSAGVSLRRLLSDPLRRERSLSALAAAFWAAYAALYLRRAFTQRGPMDWGLFLFYSLVVGLFVMRTPARRQAPWPITALALGSVVWPIIGLAPAPVGLKVLGDVVRALSLTGMIAAILSLGRSFGIAPADRGLRTGGLYRWLRHPLYAAELWFYIGYLLGNWSWRNLVVFIVALVLIVLRIRYEEALIDGYDGYARQVRWRLLPFVW
jgi:protein-S-isoprenylcysteine O-methyltransferase Ste14